MIFSDIETAFHPNIGLDEVVETLRPFQKRSGMGVADFIQFAGAVGASNCAGAPVLNASIGRVDATQAAPDGLVPEPFHDVDTILARFNDAGGFDELETNDIDPSVSHAPFDSTPNLMDGQFFIETQLRGTAFTGGEFRLTSDFLLARDNRTACEWQSFGSELPL
ncbi:hypothetical protein EIP86_008401 [Pleurotus ostreatoroseus]|nr:hypothetical protein EIP86_008401 [Pleurotus ostreatoroseus]